MDRPWASCWTGCRRAWSLPPGISRRTWHAEGPGPRAPRTAGSRTSRRSYPACIRAAQRVRPCASYSGTGTPGPRTTSPSPRCRDPATRTLPGPSATGASRTRGEAGTSPAASPSGSSPRGSWPRSSCPGSSSRPGLRRRAAIPTSRPRPGRPRRPATPWAPSWRSAPAVFRPVSANPFSTPWRAASPRPSSRCPGCAAWSSGTGSRQPACAAASTTTPSSPGTGAPGATGREA